jgi:hypothetical protein
MISALVNQVLTTLTRWVTERGATAKTRAAVAAWLKSPIGSGAGPGTDPEVQKEAATLAANIASESSDRQSGQSEAQ